MTTFADRSRQLLDALVEIDGSAARALASRSVPELRELYSTLSAKTEETEHHMAGGQDACGCDVAATNLVIIVGFAINKLDGGGRYQDWMLEESLDLLESYTALLADCAVDAGRPPQVSRVTPRLFEAL